MTFHQEAGNALEVAGTAVEDADQAQIAGTQANKDANDAQDKTLTGGRKRRGRKSRKSRKGRKGKKSRKNKRTKRR